MRGGEKVGQRQYQGVCPINNEQQMHASFVGVVAFTWKGCIYMLENRYQETVLEILRRERLNDAIQSTSRVGIDVKVGLCQHRPQHVRDLLM
jgi:hypothetical protein